MQTKAVNNISFTGRKQNVKAKKDHSEYFRWVSQNQTNDALKMSVGREVENGKFEAASTFTSLAGWIGVAGSLFSKMNVLSKASKISMEQVNEATAKSAEELAKISGKLSKQWKASGTVLLASSMALLAGSIIKDVNKNRAEKTANSRGFTTQRDRQQLKTIKDCYTATDLEYNAHVRY